MTNHRLNLLFALASLPFVLQPGVGRCDTPAPRPAAATAAPEERMDHISVTSVGTGSAVILIPGLSTPRAVWDGVASDLAKTHRVILVQVNGFGGDAPGGNLAPGILDGMVAELDRYIVREKLGQPMIIGHSMGGLAALLYARAHPDHVARVMVVDALPFIGQLFAPGATVPLIEPQARAMRDQMKASYGTPTNPAFAEGTANNLALKPDSRARVKSWVIAADVRVSAQAFYEDMTTDLRGDMAKITTPITMLYPWNEVAPSKAKADQLYHDAYAAAPNVSYVDIGDSAHFIMLDQPAAFQAALTGFVAGK